jgi:hypothetical protein
MKFAIIALLGLVQAAEVQIPNIQWDQAAVTNGTNNFNAWAQRDMANGQIDASKSINDLSMAYSRYKVAEYVSFGKNFKPLAQWDVEMVDSLTITGTCDKSIATECVNSYYMGDTTKGAAEQCLTAKAGCTSKWTALTDVQKKALADKFMTNVQTLGAAYQKMDDQLVADVKVGYAAHKLRKQAAMVDFRASMKQVASDFGCDTTCLQNCCDNHPHAHCYENCKCGSGVIKITPQKVNVLSIIKDTYGDFNQLNEDEINEVNYALGAY